jgi:hypothetical protein
VYDADGNGKKRSSDLLQVLQDLSGTFLADEHRQVSPSGMPLIFLAMSNAYVY